MSQHTAYCPFCKRLIDKELDTYYRKKYNKEIRFLQAKIDNMRVQLAIYHNNDKKWYRKKEKD